MTPPQLIFQTSRLFIRPLLETDLKSFYDMQGNLNVMRYIKATMTFEESQKELNRFIGYYKDEKNFFNIYAVEKKGTKEMIGICGVYLNDHSEYEIAYRLRETFWGNGFGKEIARGLIRYCFDELKIEELTGYVIIGNKGSTCILEKEMNFVKEFFCGKTKSTERKYQLRREQYIL